MTGSEAFKSALLRGDANRVRWLLDERPEFVRLQLSVGSDPNIGCMPIHLAAYGGHTEVVEVLLIRGADANRPENAPQQLTPLHAAVSQNHLDAARLLIENRATVDSLDARGKTPFHWAIFMKFLPMAEMLLSKGADINRKIRDWSLLHHETKDGRNDTLEFLLKHGADPNIRDARGQAGSTALHGAARHDRILAAKLLIAHGANVNAKTDSGQTVLDAAKKSPRKKIVKLLLESGARVAKKAKKIRRAKTRKKTAARKSKKKVVKKSVRKKRTSRR